MRPLSVNVLALNPSCYLAVVQGIGAGGIASLTQIIISDLVPLKERGAFNGLIAMSATSIDSVHCQC